MKAANTSKRQFEQTKLLVVNGKNQRTHTNLKQIADFFESGDVLVVNHSATMPSSFRGHLERTNEFIEIRLAAFQGPSATQLHHWQAISFGEGDWRQPTEERAPAPTLQVGDILYFGEELQAKVEAIREERILDIQFISPSLLRSLYKYGKPIQYSYHQEDLAIWDQQTIFSGPPISVEPPSAAIQFNWELLIKLREKGVKIASLLHSAGISSTGDSELDKQLPLNEWYEIPQKSVDIIQEAQRNNKKVIALGTTVLRALESSLHQEELTAGTGLASIKIQPGFAFKHINALITGIHEPQSSHIKILYSLCSKDAIQQGYQEASHLGYMNHEYGDLSLISCHAS